MIGAGDYGTELVAQAVKHPLLSLPVIADIDVEFAKKSFMVSGIPEEDIVICDSRNSALKAIESGKRAVVQDAMILMELPLDVIAEGTGETEPGAKFAYEAIKSGKHVAMINKEADSAVGPILKHYADKANLVYTAVDGDQHGLLMGMVSWARSVGFEILCGGKFRDFECGYDPVEKKAALGLCSGDYREFPIPREDIWALDIMPHDKVELYVNKRKEIMSAQPNAKIMGFDLCESLMMANQMGLKPDTPALHHPYLRYSEIASVLCLKEDGGILEDTGIVDAVTAIIDKGGPTAGGGVFIVVACGNDYVGKSLAWSPMSNKKGTATTFFRNYHLTGLETHTSILCAALLGIPTGGDTYIPKYDMVRKAEIDLKAGYIMGDDHDRSLETLMIPSKKMADGTPISGHIAEGHKLLVDVPKGTVITYGMVEKPTDSFLWALRKEQDELFLKDV